MALGADADIDRFLIVGNQARDREYAARNPRLGPADLRHVLAGHRLHECDGIRDGMGLRFAGGDFPADFGNHQVLGVEQDPEGILDCRDCRCHATFERLRVAVLRLC